MTDTGKKKKKFKFSIGLILIIVVLVFAVSYIIPTLATIKDLEKKRDSLTERYEQLVKEKEDLTAEIEAVTSPDYMERIARRDLKLIKNNELLFILPEATPKEDEEKDFSEELIDDGEESAEDEN